MTSSCMKFYYFLSRFRVWIMTLNISFLWDIYKSGQLVTRFSEENVLLREGRGCVAHIYIYGLVQEKT